MSEISQKTLQLVTSFFQIVAEGEKKTEIVRQVLAEQVLFEPYTAFKRIDQFRYLFFSIGSTRQGHIGSAELEEFFRDNKIKIHEQQEIDHIVFMMDIDRDGMVSYSDFSNYILPNSNNHLRQLANMRENYFLEQNMLLPFEVEWSLARVFDREILNSRIYQQKRDQLGFLPHKSWEKYYEKKVNNDVFILSFGNFMQDHGSLLCDDEINGFFIVIDKNNDDVIDFSEFSIMFLQSPTNQDKNQFDKTESINSNKSLSELDNNYQTPQKKTLPYQRMNQSTDFKSNLSTGNKSQLKNTNNEDYSMIIQIFYDQILNEQDVSKFQKQLSLKFDFSLFPVFCLIDYREKGFVDQYELANGFEVFGIYANRKQIELFFGRYASLQDQLNYADFSRSILPIEPKYSGLVMQRSERLVSKALSTQTIQLFRQLLIAIFDCEEQIENSRQFLALQPDFNYKQIFHLLDIQNYGYITFEAMKQHFTNLNLKATTDEILKLIKRYDKDHDGVISFAEFKNELKSNQQP